MHTDSRIGGGPSPVQGSGRELARVATKNTALRPTPPIRSTPPKYRPPHPDTDPADAPCHKVSVTKPPVSILPREKRSGPYLPPEPSPNIRTTALRHRPNARSAHPPRRHPDHHTPATDPAHVLPPSARHRRGSPSTGPARRPTDQPNLTHTQHAFNQTLPATYRSPRPGADTRSLNRARRSTYRPPRTDTDTQTPARWPNTPGPGSTSHFQLPPPRLPRGTCPSSPPPLSRKAPPLARSSLPVPRPALHHAHTPRDLAAGALAACALLSPRFPTSPPLSSPLLPSLPHPFLHPHGGAPWILPPSSD